MKSLKSQNFYEVLNVSRFASQEDIRKAYEICKTAFQGDSLATYSLYSDEENQEIFAQISQAYETLRNPASRRDYDTYLADREGLAVPGRAEETQVAASIFGANRPSPPPVGMLERKPAPESNGSKATSPAEDADGAARMDRLLSTVKVFTGNTLKKARHVRGLSLEELAEKTKIRKAYLQYLEEENFEFLPAAVYIKGFVIIIANALSLPAQQVAKDYMEKYYSKAPSDEL